MCFFLHSIAASHVLLSKRGSETLLIMFWSPPTVDHATSSSITEHSWRNWKKATIHFLKAWILSKPATRKRKPCTLPKNVTENVAFFHCSFVGWPSYKPSLGQVTNSGQAKIRSPYRLYSRYIIIMYFNIYIYIHTYIRLGLRVRSSTVSCFES